MIEYLDKKLEEYGKSDMYPFHMPGHKRAHLEMVNPYTIDITEIEGFDNLHHAEEILLDAQRRAAELYHSMETFYLINGSTCGVLTAILASVKKGDRILMARNCHKAAYHAAFLGELLVDYLYPEVTKNGIQGSVQPQQIQKALQVHPDIQAVILTSPTYDGVVSDIRQIADIAHAHRIPLIVDEAHGAHLRFHEEFPASAVDLGADLVVQSLHKTLPAFTQTAVLHWNSSLVPLAKVRKYLGIFETSSPSYLLMASMEKCIRMIAEDGDTLFIHYVEQLHKFYDQMSGLRELRVMMPNEFDAKEIYGWDFAKILIFVDRTHISGEQLYQILLKKYHLQMEMCTGNYVTAMTSIMDTEAGYKRLAEALKEIDTDLFAERVVQEQSDGQRAQMTDFIRNTYVPKRKELEIFLAESLPHQSVPLEKAEGLLAGEYVYLYPPGIPVIVPGEIVDHATIRTIQQCVTLGLKVEGMEDRTNRFINIVNF